MLIPVIGIDQFLYHLHRFELPVVGVNILADVSVRILPLHKLFNVVNALILSEKYGAPAGVILIIQRIDKRRHLALNAIAQSEQLVGCIGHVVVR